MSEEIKLPEAMIMIEKCKQGEGDAEDKHWNADEILCKVLRSLGYGELSDAFEEIEKWYA